MPDAEHVVWEKTGRAIPGQWPERLAQFLEGVLDGGWERALRQMEAVALAGTTPITSA